MSASSYYVIQLNGGIKGIDKVLGQFGGNGSVINAIHYATGSNGALTRNQLAMVNDAGYGSRQEAIVHNGNVIFEVSLWILDHLDLLLLLNLSNCLLDPFDKCL